jgi:phospholipid transport system substrate-binding protein
MNVLKFAGVAFALMVGQMPVAGAAVVIVADPREMVGETSDALIVVIEQGKQYYDTDPGRFYAEVQNVLDPAIDFDAFARGVMAVHYKRASEAQRTRFVEAFRAGLVRTYAKALLEFSDEQIVVLPETKPPRDPKKQMVKMEVRSSAGKVYPAVYAMRLYDDGQWRIRNIIINGINIGLTYRNQFASAMKAAKHGGDLDSVIDSWSESLADVEQASEPSDSST